MADGKPKLGGGFKAHPTLPPNFVRDYTTPPTTRTLEAEIAAKRIAAGKLAK